MRTAWSALKHTHEKVGDHWKRKDKKGPVRRAGQGQQNTNHKTAGGVDANATKSTCTRSPRISTSMADRKCRKRNW